MSSHLIAYLHRLVERSEFEAVMVVLSCPCLHSDPSFWRKLIADPHDLALLRIRQGLVGCTLRAMELTQRPPSCVDGSLQESTPDVVDYSQRQPASGIAPLELYALLEHCVPSKEIRTSETWKASAARRCIGEELIAIRRGMRRGEHMTIELSELADKLLLSANDTLSRPLVHPPPDAVDCPSAALSIAQAANIHREAAAFVQQARSAKRPREDEKSPSELAASASGQKSRRSEGTEAAAARSTDEQEASQSSTNASSIEQLLILTEGAVRVVRAASERPVVAQSIISTPTTHPSPEDDDPTAPRVFDSFDDIDGFAEAAHAQARRPSAVQRRQAFSVAEDNAIVEGLALFSGPSRFTDIFDHFTRQGRIWKEGRTPAQIADHHRAVLRPRLLQRSVVTAGTK